MYILLGLEGGGMGVWGEDDGEGGFSERKDLMKQPARLVVVSTRS